MGPELSTAAADQNFAWICKQHQDLIGSVLIFRTKIIWSGPEFGLVRCGYLNASINTLDDIMTIGVETSSVRPHLTDNITFQGYQQHFCSRLCSAAVIHFV